MECGTNNCHWKQLQFVQWYGHNIRHNIRRFCQCNCSGSSRGLWRTCSWCIPSCPSSGPKDQHRQVNDQQWAAKCRKCQRLGFCMPLNTSSKTLCPRVCKRSVHVWRLCVIMGYLLMFCFKFSIYHCHGPFNIKFNGPICDLAYLWFNQISLTPRLWQTGLLD